MAQETPRVTSENEVEEHLQTVRDGLPGRRDALKPGALGGVRVDPQGDENRDPPTDAPTMPG
jgi:hypothetical protein